MIRLNTTGLNRKCLHFTYKPESSYQADCHVEVIQTLPAYTQEMSQPESHSRGPASFSGASNVHGGDTITNNLGTFPLPTNDFFPAN